MVSIVTSLLVDKPYLKSMTLGFLQNVRMFTDDYELIIVQSLVKEENPQFRNCMQKHDQYFCFPYNLSVPASLNYGISKAKREYITLLSNDVFVTKSWLPPLLNYLIDPEYVCDYASPITNTFFPDITSEDRKMGVNNWSLVNLKGVTAHKSLYEEVGPFNEKLSFFRWSSDYRKRLATKGKRGLICKDSFATNIDNMTWVGSDLHEKDPH